MKTLKIFKDDRLNKEFIEEGYVKFQLFNNDDCSKIKKEAKKFVHEHPKLNNEIWSIPSPLNTDEESEKLHSFFQNLTEEKVYDHLSGDYDFFYSNLLIKNQRSTDFFWHADLSVYNLKSNNTSINIWAGIEKTTKKNGCLRVIPRSHKLSFDYEAFPFSPFGHTPRSLNLKAEYDKLINKYAIDVPLKKGEVIIHHHSLIHASHPNNSYFKKRIAYKISLNPKGVDFFEVAHFNKEKKKLLIYGVQKEVLYPNLSPLFTPITFDELIKNNQLSLLKEVDLSNSNSPFKTLKEINYLAS